MTVGLAFGLRFQVILQLHNLERNGGTTTYINSSWNGIKLYQLPFHHIILILLGKVPFNCQKIIQTHIIATQLAVLQNTCPVWCVSVLTSAQYGVSVCSPQPSVVCQCAHPSPVWCVSMLTPAQCGVSVCSPQPSVVCQCTHPGLKFHCLPLGILHCCSESLLQSGIQIPHLLVKGRLVGRGEGGRGKGEEEVDREEW